MPPPPPPAARPAPACPAPIRSVVHSVARSVPPGPTLAIVTVVKNDLVGLRATQRSLAAQTCRDFAWVVADGGSRDGTAAWLDANRHVLARAWSRPDAGTYDAMNQATHAIPAPYVLFLNAGDRLAAPDTLAVVIGSLKADRPDFLYGDSLEDQADGLPMLKPARSHRAAWYGMFTHHQAMVYRRALLPAVPFDRAYPIGADYALTLSVLARSRRIRKLDLPLAWVAPPGLSARHPAQGRRDEATIRRRQLGWPLVATAALSLLHWGLFETRRRCPLAFRLVRCRSAGAVANPTAAMENVAVPQRPVVADETARQLTFGI